MYKNIVRKYALIWKDLFLNLTSLFIITICWNSNASKIKYRL